MGLGARRRLDEDWEEAMTDGHATILLLAVLTLGIWALMGGRREP